MPFTRSVPLTLWLIPIWTEVNLPGMPKFNGAYEIKLLQNVNESIRTETYMQRGTSWRTKRSLQVTIQNEDATRKTSLKSILRTEVWNSNVSETFALVKVSSQWRIIVSFMRVGKGTFWNTKFTRTSLRKKKTEETSRIERSANQRCSLSSGFCPEILVLWWLDYRELSVVVW